VGFEPTTTGFTDHVLQTGSRSLFHDQTIQRREAESWLLSLRSSVPAARRSRPLTGPTVSRETPAPFTSRSPGIATLGPSWTTHRKLNRVDKFRNDLNEGLPRQSCLAAHLRWVLMESRRAVEAPSGHGDVATGSRRRSPVFLVTELCSVTHRSKLRFE